MISGIKQIAVIANDTVVLCKKLTADSSIAPENIPSDDASGTVWGGKSWVADIGLYDGDISQLQQWMISNTEVQVVGLGQQGCWFWYEPTTISENSILNPNARDGLSPSRLILTRVNPLADIGNGVNIFKAVAKTPDSGFPTDSAYNPKRAFNAPGDFFEFGSSLEVDGSFRGIEFLFPFEGVTLNFSLKAGAGETVRARIVAKSDTTTLATETGSASSAGGVGSASLVTPAGTYLIELSADGSNAQTATEAVARVDGFTAYTNQ
jgi:hypothetical protein